MKLQLRRAYSLILYLLLLTAVLVLAVRVVSFLVNGVEASSGLGQGSSQIVINGPTATGSGSDSD